MCKGGNDLEITVGEEHCVSGGNDLEITVGEEQCVRG